MNDTKFWRIVAILSVFGLYYVGHGMRTGHPAPIPEFHQRAFAGGVSVYSTDTTNKASLRIITTTEDGHLIRVWQIRKGSNRPEFYGEFSAKKK